jgi:uncharacterized membrane protein
MGNLMLLKNKKKENTEKPKEKKDSNLTKIPSLNTFKIIVSSMLGLSTLGIILVFVDLWMVTGVLVLLSYVLLIVLAIKLFIGKSQ